MVEFLLQKLDGLWYETNFEQTDNDYLIILNNAYDTHAWNFDDGRLLISWWIIFVYIININNQNQNWKKRAKGTIWWNFCYFWYSENQSNAHIFCNHFVYYNFQVSWHLPHQWKINIWSVGWIYWIELSEAYRLSAWLKSIWNSATSISILNLMICMFLKKML